MVKKGLSNNMDAFHNLLKRQLKYRGIKVFLLTMFLDALLMILNLLVDYEGTSSGAADAQVPVIVMFIVGVGISLLSLIAIGFAMSLFTYFLAAFLGVGFKIELFVRLTGRALLCYPLMVAMDSLQLLIFGERLVERGVWGAVFYLPFYFMMYHMFFSITPYYVSMTEKRLKVFCFISTLAMIIATYPYSGG